MKQQFDYIVIGGGSSGCIVAARLVEENLGSVLLIESGESVESNPVSKKADGFTQAFANDHLMLDRMSLKQQSCRKRAIYVGSGRGMGGSGSVNGMVYTRGDKLDFEQWPKGWQWQDIDSAFTAVEERLRIRTRAATAFTKTAIDAVTELNFEQKDALNDGNLCGYIGYNSMNFEGDERRSSYMAFIHQQDLGQLTVKTGATVHRLLFDKSEGKNQESKKASGVELKIAGIKQIITVNKEVIFCAGALETPKLLMLSGIGPKQQLQQFSIPIVKVAEYIGQHLHDHPNICLFYKGRNKVDFSHSQIYGFGRSNKLSVFSGEQLAGKQLAEGQADTCFTFLAAGAILQQSMYRMLPALILPGRLFYNKALRRIIRKLVDGLFSLPFVTSFVDQVYGIVVILGKPQSRGQMRLASKDVNDQALIDPAYYSHPDDMQTMLKGIEIAKQMAKQQGFQAWGNKGLVVANRKNDKTAIQKWIEGTTMTTFHYSGTCKMGEGDDAPVDGKLKLKGFDNIRVADASVIPEIPVSAINAPCMMIAYRAAEFIVADADR